MLIFIHQPETAATRGPPAGGAWAGLPAGSYDLKDRELYPKKTKISAMGEDTILASAKEKIDSFEKKHGCNLKTFEHRIMQLP